MGVANVWEKKEFQTQFYIENSKSINQFGDTVVDGVTISDGSRDERGKKYEQDWCPATGFVNTATNTLILR